jgi:tetratricopeptide (TPR) repeat protein
MYYLILLLFLSCESPQKYEVYYINRSIFNLVKTKTILIFPFKNISLPKYNYYSEGITESVVNDLSLVKGISVISQDDRKKALRELAYKQAIGLDDKDISKIANITGADLFFTGSYSIEENQIRIIARLIDSSSGNTVKSIKIDGITKDIFVIQDNLALKLIEFTTSISPEEKGFIQNKPLYSEKAFELFSKGLEIEESNPKSALEFYKNAIKIQNNYIDALNKAGNVSLLLNEVAESLKYFERVTTLKEKMGLSNTPDFAMTMLKIGNAHKLKGDYDSALVYYNKSKELYEKLGSENTSGYASTLGSIGNVYKDKGENENALEYYKKSQIMRDKLNLQNTSGYATTINNIGFIYSSTQKYELSLEQYNKSQALREKLGLENTSGYASTMNNIGSVFNIKKEYDKAIQYYNKAKAIREKLGQQYTLDYATILSNLSIVFENKGDFKKAQEYFEKAKLIKSKSTNQLNEKNSGE